MSGARGAGDIRAASEAVVNAWESLGRCEGEFMPDYPAACSTHREWLDTRIDELRTALAAALDGRRRGYPWD